MLKSDLRGIEIWIIDVRARIIDMLKSDLRGIEMKLLEQEKKYI